ncbi:MAG TPA: DUF72 domain-containing protein [Vicinamibacterales bacterium]|nr:DUF72 domain-containing protein [Vicinamibacterales bacterium]
MARGRARVGCSGWQYKHWRGDFYPAAVPQARWFEYYAERFDTVEINNSFYRLPERGTFAAWARRAPPGFVFSVKASRFLTHMKKLKDPEEPIERLFSRMEALGAHLGPVLYQLPPGWTVNVERFAGFLDALPRGIRHVVEFRDPTWYDAGIRRLMHAHGVALCLHDMPGSATGRLSTSPFVYVRFHGSGQKYGGGYSPARLHGWAEWLNARRDEGCDVYAYFNNDVGGHAPRDAMTLRRALEETA